MYRELCRAEAVRAKIWGRSANFVVKNGGGQLQTKKIYGAVSYELYVCIHLCHSVYRKLLKRMLITFVDNFVLKMFDPSSFFWGGGGGGVDYDPKKWGGKKRQGRQSLKGGSLAVGTYLKEAVPPPPPPRGRRLIRGGRPAWEQGTMGCS